MMYNEIILFIVLAMTITIPKLLKRNVKKLKIS